MREPVITPVQLVFRSAKAKRSPDVPLVTFDSYQFERSILTPAAAFRFTAPGINKSTRTAIRSGDMVTIWVIDQNGQAQQIATGFVDETDTHVTPEKVEYLVTGRDTLGQLVDNAAVDASNGIQNVQAITLDKILSILIANTQIPKAIVPRSVPNAPLVFQTNIGETRINALQRYLDFTNCLVWSQPNGQVVIGKPNFAQTPYGLIVVDPAGTSNCIEARVRRSPNLAIRQIVTQLQTLNQVNAGQFTVYNSDTDVKNIAVSRAGRSVYNIFSYGSGGDSINTVTHQGNQSGNPSAIGASLSRREIARENMKVLDVEAVFRGHLNDNNVPFNIDQVYTVNIPDDDLNEDMYVYSVSYELTLDHGMLTRLKLCRQGSIVADAPIFNGAKS